MQQIKWKLARGDRPHIFTGEKPLKTFYIYIAPLRAVQKSAFVLCDSTKELITRPRCLSFSFQVFQGDWKKCTMRIYIWFLELWEFRDRQKLVIYISHMHFMVSIISKFVKAFSCTFYYYTKQIKILSFKCQTHYQAAVTQSAPTILSDIFEKSFGLKRSCVNCYVLLIFGLFACFISGTIVSLLTVGLCWSVRVKRTRSKTKGASQTHQHWQARSVTFWKWNAVFFNFFLFSKSHYCFAYSLTINCF